MNKKEIYKSISGYENYLVSNTGRILSLNYMNSGRIKELKQKLNKYGYYEVTLCKFNKRKSRLVSTIVAETFIENPMQKPKVIHISENKLDNSVENLMWAYESEKNHHMYNLCTRNWKSSNTKITYKGKKYKSYYEIARDYDIKSSTFWNRINRQEWGLYEAIEIPISKRKEI